MALSLSLTVWATSSVIACQVTANDRKDCSSIKATPCSRSFVSDGACTIHSAG